MTDGGRIAASDLNKEKKEFVALIQAQDFAIDDACPIKTIGGRQIAMHNVLHVMHIFVNQMARLTLSS